MYSSKQELILPLTSPNPDTRSAKSTTEGTTTKEATRAPNDSPEPVYMDGILPVEVGRTTLVQLFLNTEAFVEDSMEVMSWVAS